VKQEKKALIVFDIGNVLVRFSPARAGRNFDRLIPGAGAKLIDLIWKTRLGLDFERGRMSGAAFHRECQRRAGLRIPYKDFRRAFCDIFTPMRANLNLLRRLSAHHPTALLSNTNPIHWRHIRRAYPLLNRARFPLASHLLKEMKPAPVVYRRLAARTGFPLKNMVYVDDHPDFVAAARRLGVRALCYDGRTSLRRLLTRAGIDV
jgi:HAD superfamily hydrolase (TIGR01509 family)